MTEETVKGFICVSVSIYFVALLGIYTLFLSGLGNLTQ